MTPIKQSHLTIKTLSYNMHKGQSIGNMRNVLKKMKTAIRDIQADLVFLQEVRGLDKDQRSNAKSSQFEYLADSIWHHYAYGKNAVTDRGHHGNAILSKYPFVSWENVDISTNQLERRGLLHGVIRVPNTNVQVHLLCLHLNLLEGGRSKQINRLCDRIDMVVPHDQPLIIGGDFNDWRQRISDVLHQRLGVREAHLDVHDDHARTFPSWMPLLKLDRVYYRGFIARTASSLCGQPWRALSDHAAYFAELELVIPTPSLKPDSKPAMLANDSVSIKRKLMM